LFRPQNLIGYGDPDLAALAAAYSFGLARNPPFIDSNKCTAFTVVELFLALNGQELIADDPSCIVTILKLAEGSLTEAELADWIRTNTNPS
jgi:death-on-curing protein